MRQARLLLVDDEQNVVDGLRRLLRPLRKEWDVRTAISAREALALLEDQSADVVMTDMRMPGTDGAGLLAAVKLRSPSAVRIVLSGQTDSAAALRVAPLAHQFLCKPCDPTELIDTLARIYRALEALDDPRVATAIGAIGSLASPPALWARVTEMIADDDVPIADIGAVIETDPALASKLLQLTNSSFFGLRRRVSNIVEAASYLGVEVIRGLVMTLGVSDMLPPRASLFDLPSFQHRSMQTAQIARSMASGPNQADDWFTSGLLHCIGDLVLASAMPARYDALARAAATSGRTLDEEEAAAPDLPPRLRLGVHLLRMWGLPWNAVEAIANHPLAPEVERNELGAAGAVFLARQLLREATGEGPCIDADFIAQLGLEPRLEGWRAQAVRVAA